MRAIAILLIFLLLAVPAAGASWSRGEGWGYKWVVDPNQDFSNYDFNGTVEGKTVLGLYVEYQGEENGLYNFSYIGSFYSYHSLNGTLVVNSPRYIEDTWHHSSGFFWINSEGYILLEKCNVTDSFSREHTVYAIKEQYMHIYSKEPMRLDVDMDTSTSTYSYHYRANYTGSFDLTLRVQYSQPIPYIPVNSPDTMNYYSRLNFTGHVRANGAGYSSYSGNGIHMNNTIDMNGTVDKDVSGSSSVLVKMDVDGNNVTRASVLEALPVVFSELPGIFANPESYISSRLKTMLLLANKATLNGDFYQSIYVNNNMIGLKAYKSENATKEDVEKIRTEAPEIYGGKEESPGYNLMALVAIGAAVVIIIIVTAIIMGKKSQRGET